VSFGKEGATFINPNGSPFMFGKIAGTMYKLDLNPPTVSALSARSHNRPMDLVTWHHRLGHVGMGAIVKLMMKKLVDGLSVMLKMMKGLCEDCIFGKQAAVLLMKW
jgi:hypothetical protein